LCFKIVSSFHGLWEKEVPVWNPLLFFSLIIIIIIIIITPGDLYYLG